ncbi:MAG TPA: pilus assembly PilX N-terminal domain-containing protein [Candidatus Bathyarchaeia archaeon]|nr:pilus assembly PilX N-terminal domain-containing protein [Candidatus Bathyarchaeia archaeon]
MKSPTDERGAALPLATITLALLGAVLIGLSTLSATEPVIAGNQVDGARAQALAESGLERALWAVQHPEAAAGVPSPLPTPVPPPYDGSRLLTLTSDVAGLGGFRLTMLPGARPHERQILSVGWVPTDDAADARPKAQRSIAATLWRVRVPAETAPCALCALNDITLDDGAAVDARTDLRCGAKTAAWSSGAVSVAASARVAGADADYRQAQPADAAAAWRFDAADLAALKRIARAQGTYYQGTVVFDASRPAPRGLVFVDTAGGIDLGAATPPDEAGRVEMRGGSFQGWLVVAGSIEVSGDARIRGMAYAQDAFTYRGTAPGGIEGQVVATGIRGGAALLARSGDDSALTFDCAAARDGDGTVPAGWRVKAGSYREAPDS